MKRVEKCITLLKCTCEKLCSLTIIVLLLNAYYKYRCVSQESSYSLVTSDALNFKN